MRYLGFLKKFGIAFTSAVGVATVMLAVAAVYYYEEDSGSASTQLSVHATVNEDGTTAACKEGYGFLPCSTSLGGSIFLTLVYGAILMLGAQFIGDGGEAMLELELCSPSIIGGVILPVLGAVPDAAIIFVACFGHGSPDENERKVQVGIGTLAGSTIMLITIAFAGSLWLGRTDIVNGEAVDETLDGEAFDSSQDFCVTNNPGAICRQAYTTGITYEPSVIRIMIFMMATSLCYIVAQVPEWILQDDHATQLACLGGAIACLVFLLLYLADSAWQTSAEDSNAPAVRRSRIKNDLVKELDAEQIVKKMGEFVALSKGQKSPLLAKASIGRKATKVLEDTMAHGLSAEHKHDDFNLYNTDGTVNAKTVDAMFDAFDVDCSGYLDEKETATFVRVVFMSGGEREVPDRVWQQLEEARITMVAPDESKGQCGCGNNMQNKVVEKHISREDFVHHVCNLLEESYLSYQAEETEEKEDLEQGNVEVEPGMSAFDATIMVLVGTAIAAAFSDSMVDAIDSVGQFTGIPNFVIGFVVCPFASNASELLSSLQLASRKKTKNNCVTFAQIYAACCMNNSMCLGIFYFMVWIKDLQWNFGAEVISIVAVTWIVAFSTGFKLTVKSYIGFLALLLYPLSLAAVEAMHRIGIH
jgi:Ca2+/Na+ antiporter